jgi:hypothetical protein
LVLIVVFSFFPLRRGKRKNKKQTKIAPLFATNPPCEMGINQSCTKEIRAKNHFRAEPFFPLPYKSI